MTITTNLSVKVWHENDGRYTACNVYFFFCGGPFVSCHMTCSVRVSAQTEDEPIGWFELEEDWNDVEIKLQQCRVAKVTVAHPDSPFPDTYPFTI